MSTFEQEITISPMERTSVRLSSDLEHEILQKLSFFASKIETLESLFSDVYLVRTEVNEVMRGYAHMRKEVDYLGSAMEESMARFSESMARCPQDDEESEDYASLVEEVRNMGENFELATKKMTSKLRKLRKKVKDNQLEVRHNAIRCDDIDLRVVSCDKIIRNVKKEVSISSERTDFLEMKMAKVSQQMHSYEKRTQKLEDNVDDIQQTLAALNGNMTRLTEKRAFNIYMKRLLFSPLLVDATIDKNRNSVTVDGKKILLTQETQVVKCKSSVLRLTDVNNTSFEFMSSGADTLEFLCRLVECGVSMDGTLLEPQVFDIIEEAPEVPIAIESNEVKVVESVQCSS